MFSQTTTSAGAVDAPSVLWLTAFQLQASKALYVLYTTTEDAGHFCLFSLHCYVCIYHSGTLIGHTHSQVILKTRGVIDSDIKFEWMSYWTCSVLSYIPLISEFYISMQSTFVHSLCQDTTLASLRSEHFCQCHLYFDFLLQRFSLALKKQQKSKVIKSVLLLLYCKMH